MSTPAAVAARILLLERRDTAAPRAPGSARVRRYRLARVRVDGRPVGPHSRFEHLKRSYD